MILSISDSYRIKTDIHNWIIQKQSGFRKNRKTSNKEVNWKDIGYYSSLQNATTGLYQYMVRVSSAESLREALSESERALALITTALEKKFGCIRKRVSCDQCVQHKCQIEKSGI